MENENESMETYCKQNNRLDLLKEWNYDKNKVLPLQVSPNSSKKVWWKCSKMHDFLASPNERTNKKRGCPFCKASE